MSAEAVGWVYRHSPYSGSTLLVHLAIADSVNDQHSNEFWMTLPKLGVKARVNRGTAKRAVDQLVSDGFLETMARSSGGRNLGSTYRFCFPAVPVVYETRASHAGSDETRASEDETRAGDTATRVAGAAHRTQEEPKGEPKTVGRSFFCRDCETEIFTLTAYMEHIDKGCDSWAAA